MAMNISAWAIRKPISSLVMFLVLMVVGTISFIGLPVMRFPSIDVPLVNVTVTQAGAAPAELETQVTKRIEDAVSGIQNVKKVTSKIADGTSTTTVEFRLEVNTDRALNDIKDAVAKIRADLPRTIDEPVISRVEIAGLPIATYGAFAPQMTVAELSWYVDDKVARELQSVKGVAEVKRFGGVDREIRVTLDPDRMFSFGITAADVNRQLRAVHVDLAGGRGEIGGQEQSIRTLAGTHSLEDLGDVMINISGGRRVRLDEIATIADTSAEARTFARFNGEPVVSFSISRGRGGSDAVLAPLIQARIDKLQKAHPEVQLKLLDSSVPYTVGNYKASMSTLVEGALLAIIVVFLFLRDIRATIIAAIALPMSVIPAFFGMELMGFSLNLVSLLAITLVTGILVDDAIVEIENIVRHMRMGKSPYRASIEAADEIGLAVIAITMTIVAVFAPVSFMGGIPGQYFKQFGLTVAVAVIFSLLVARLITPMLTAYFLKPHKVHDEGNGFVMRNYTRLISWSVSHRYITVGIGIALFVVSIKAMVLLPSGFLPGEDAARTLMVVELAPGSRIEDTRETADKVQQLLRKRPEIQSVFVQGGYAPRSGLDIRRLSLTINYVHKTKRKITQKQLEDSILTELNDIPDIRFWRLNDNGDRGISLLVLGEDDALTADVAAQLVSDMKRVPIIQGGISTAALDRPEIQIKPKTDIAADLGVTTDTIAETVRVATIGEVGANLAKFDVGDRLVPIRVMIPEEARTDPRVIEALRVPSAKAGSVPLATVADVTYAIGPSSIDRYNRSRRIAVEADMFRTDALGAALEQICNTPTGRRLAGECVEILRKDGKPVDESKLIPGVQLVTSGDAEIMQEIFTSFATAMGAGVMMVYAVLVLLFASFLQPITILLSLPLSFGGVVFSLLATGKPVSLPVVIGLLMLMGIVTKNAIMLVEFAVEEVAKGIDRVEAIIDAGRKRARPIVMTTIAMGAGMVPSAMGTGDGGEFRSPMAIAVVGGLIVSTLLSLVFVPAFFLVMDDLSRGIWWVFGRFVGKVDEPPEYLAQQAAARASAQQAHGAVSQPDQASPSVPGKERFAAE